MAWLEQHPISGTYQLNFRLGGAKFKRSLKTNDKTEATTRLARVEENIRLVEAGRLVLPEDGDDPVGFCKWEQDAVNQLMPHLHGKRSLVQAQA